MWAVPSAEKAHEKRYICGEYLTFHRLLLESFLLFCPIELWQRCKQGAQCSIEQSDQLHIALASLLASSITRTAAGTAATSANSGETAVTQLLTNTGCSIWAELEAVRKQPDGHKRGVEVMCESAAPLASIKFSSDNTAG